MEATRNRTGKERASRGKPKVLGMEKGVTNFMTFMYFGVFGDLGKERKIPN